MGPENGGFLGFSPKIPLKSSYGRPEMPENGCFFAIFDDFLAKPVKKRSEIHASAASVGKTAQNG